MSQRDIVAVERNRSAPSARRPEGVELARDVDAPPAPPLENDRAADRVRRARPKATPGTLMALRIALRDRRRLQLHRPASRCDHLAGDVDKRLAVGGLGVRSARHLQEIVASEIERRLLARAQPDLAERDGR